MYFTGQADAQPDLQSEFVFRNRGEATLLSDRDEQVMGCSIIATGLVVYLLVIFPVAALPPIASGARGEVAQRAVGFTMVSAGHFTRTAKNIAAARGPRLAQLAF